MKEAIVKQNPETKLFIVIIYYRHDTPSGCERWIPLASTEEMPEEKAKKMATDFNNEQRLSG